MQQKSLSMTEIPLLHLQSYCVIAFLCQMKKLRRYAIWYQNSLVGNWYFKH